MADSLQLMTESSVSASSFKRHKLSNEEANFNDNIDRISDLPDSVICHILSFLTTKNAAVTSILSTRWRYLWTWVTTLDFEYLRGFQLVYLNVGDRVGYRSFVDLVCRALFLRNSGSCIKKFRLFCPVNSLDLESSDSFHFNAWVCAAVTRGVEELDLSHLIVMPFDQPVELTQCVKLPQSLFTCKTLKTFPYVSNDDLPMFHNLTRLKIIGAWHLLPNFLENSHNLRVLSLEETCYRSDRHGCCRWPQCVPKCLSSHLMTIHIERFEGLKGELKLVRYILKNAKVLKTMSICCHRNSKEKARLLEKILMFPRGSETCQVTIN